MDHKTLTNRSYLLFHRNLLVSNGSNGSDRFHWNNFLLPHPAWVKSLTNRTWTFPLESVHVQWIRWIPSERLSTPSSKMVELFWSLSWIKHGLFHRNWFVSNGSPPLVDLHTSRLPLFRSMAGGYNWNLVDSTGLPSFGFSCNFSGVSLHSSRFLSFFRWRGDRTSERKVGERRSTPGVSQKIGEK